MSLSKENLAKDVKQAVLSELRAGNYGGMPGNFPTQAPDQGYQALKESIKGEILAEIRMQQFNRMAQAYGLEKLLSDQKIQQMIDQRHQAIDDLKADIKKGLLALQKIDEEQAKSPQTSQIANLLAEGAQKLGVPLEQVIQGLERKPPSSTNVLEQVSELLNDRQSKGFLCGMGAVIMCHLIWPFIKNNMHSVAARSVEEGMAMVDRAKSFIGAQQQNPPPTPPNQEPPPPPPPPEGG